MNRVLKQRFSQISRQRNYLFTARGEQAASAQKRSPRTVSPAERPAEAKTRSARV